jgi:hypothetical protein
MTGRSTLTLHVLRPLNTVIFGWLILILLPIAPILLWTSAKSPWPSIIAALVALAVGGIIWLGISTQKMIVSEAGIYVVADDDNYTLTWDDIERFDCPIFLEIHRSDGRMLNVHWITAGETRRIMGMSGYADRKTRQLNQMLAERTGRAAQPIAGDRPALGMRYRYAKGLYRAILILGPCALVMMISQRNEWVAVMIAGCYVIILALTWLFQHLTYRHSLREW